jgi:hypothetical protein
MRIGLCGERFEPNRTGDTRREEEKKPAYVKGIVHRSMWQTASPGMRG